jgi:hypothetical protein
MVVMAVSFSFTVGVDEPHHVTVRVAGIRNRVTIEVDGWLAADSGGNLGRIMPNVFDVEVGVQERHMVSIRVIIQEPIDGGARYIDVFIDGRFAARHDWRAIRES